MDNAEYYHEDIFKEQIKAALVRCKKLLDNTRNPQHPEDVSHTYTDKFHFVEFVTNLLIAAELNVLEVHGLTTELLKKLKEWQKTRSVTLRFESTEMCKFDREVEREVEQPTKHVTEIAKQGSAPVSITEKIITKVKEYFWKFTVDYQFSVYQGNNVSEKITLQTRQASYEIKTSTKRSPRAEVTTSGKIEVDISWLLSNLNDNLQACFSINREDKLCHTPRRNKQVTETFEFSRNLSQWSTDVTNYFLRKLFPVQANHSLDLSSLHARNIFVPIVPLFEEVSTMSDEDSAQTSVVLSLADVNQFLHEHRRSISEKFDDLAKSFPTGINLITLAEAKLVVIIDNNLGIIREYFSAVNFIEALLRKQLISAIGKEVTPVEFAQYMTYHNRKLFKAAYEPRKFCYAIRRPDHYPEGTFSIEAETSLGVNEPISTIVRHDISKVAMNFSINAATNISFFGERYLHAFVGHEFSSQAATKYNLVARARQFSCFIILLGRIVSSTKFEPQHALIIQNKDDLLIPLLFEQLPTAKQFRDAVESLSPEQQAFATAFRSMQLESTLFGVCIIQIKPQLEKLLNLPADSLTKEIKLTQDLLELFIKYQIPSDLISYAGSVDESQKEKVNVVREHVAAMQKMIHSSKEQEIQEQKQVRQYTGMDDLDSLLDELDQRKEVLPSKRSRWDEDRDRSRSSDRRGDRDGCDRSAGGSRGRGRGGGGGFLQAKSFHVNKKVMLPEMCATSHALASMTAEAAKVDRCESFSRNLGAPTEFPAVQLSAAKAATVESPATNSEPQAHPPSIKDQHFHDEETTDLGIDYAKIPKQLDSSLEALDEDAAMHSTIIQVGPTWTKKFQKALLANPESESLLKENQENERNRAFDLLDALSRSGVLPFDEVALHVVLASTHSFDKTLMNTLVQDNVNPIEKVERSTLIVASTVHDAPAAEMIKQEHASRLQKLFPKLF